VNTYVRRSIVRMVYVIDGIILYGAITTMIVIAAWLSVILMFIIRIFQRYQYTNAANFHSTSIRSLHNRLEITLVISEPKTILSSVKFYYRACMIPRSN
jgi:hypothetical protein